jgi:TetR/AcrR family transcriptional repressor of nem operon
MPLQKTTPEEIIKKSINVFRAKGYYRTSMNDLAEGAGLTKGIFYHYFSGKEDVMKRALEATRLWFNNKIFSIAYDESITKKERLEKIAATIFKAFTDNPGGCFFANTILETVHVEATFVTEITAFFELWEKAMAHLFEDSYTGDALKELTQQVIADIEGSIVIMQLKKDPDLLQKALDRSVNKL